MSQPGGRRLLAFDFGRRRIGVAVGQETTSQASPVGTLDSVGGKPDWAAIAGLMEEWRPDCMVVGHPRHADEGASETTRASRRFARQLEGRFALPVELVDERLSSWEADLRRRESGSRGTRRASVDALAACVILETWFQHQSGA